MTTEDKSQMPLFSPEDEKEAQKALDHHSTNGTLKATNKWTGFQGKTMWEWLQLLGVLAIPLVVTGATLLFGIQQANLANQQHENDQKIANQQHEADKKQALDQQQAALLQTYIDNIQDLLLNHNLLKSKPTDDVAILARARTLAALQGLDSARKGRLMQFIYEAQLIGFLDSKNNLHGPLIDLSNANLSGADLSNAHLYGADLSNAILSDANLTDAILSGANLRKADLSRVYLINADLISANLSDANLIDAQMTQQQLDQVYACKGATLPEGLTCHHNQ